MKHFWMLALFILWMSAQAQEILEKYKPAMDLGLQVVAILEMEKTTELTLSAEQASSLLPIFTYLQTSETLTNDEATAYKQQMDEAILTPEQHDWLATKTSELSQQTPDQRTPPPDGMGMVMKLMRGEPVNLVKKGASKEALTKLVEILSDKTG